MIDLSLKGKYVDDWWFNGAVVVVAVVVGEPSPLHRQGYINVLCCMRLNNNNCYLCEQ